MTSSKKSFTLENDVTGKIAVITFDVPGARVNTLSTGVAGELCALLDKLSSDQNISAITLLSGKKDSFIAGADIKEFMQLESEEAAVHLVEHAQAIMNSIANFPKPIVMGIHGNCLGGGLEMALASHYRVATNSSITSLGLPEVQLGLIPAAGGCQRLPRLIGTRAALDIILSGRKIRAKQAKRLGLVDELVPAPILRTTATNAAQRLADGWRPSRRSPTGTTAYLLDRNPFGRRLVYYQAKRQILKRTRGHYPAPLAALNAIKTGLVKGMATGLKREASFFAELLIGNVSRKLVQLFFSTTTIKKRVNLNSSKATSNNIDRLGVVGAGFMGSSIAGVAALRAGTDVRLQDTEISQVAKGLGNARNVINRSLRRRRIDLYEHRRRLALLSGTANDSGFHSRDLIIEAVFEDLGVKKNVISKLEQTVSKTCILASNTSTIPISSLQAGAMHPERILGIHFFSPVEKMPLVEIIRGQATADHVTVAAVNFANRLGKTVIVVKDSPGFWVNRILAPYLNEANWLLQEGTSIDKVDKAMIAFGFPVGPLTLLDEIGLDIAEKASAVLDQAFGERLAPAPTLSHLIKMGKLGRKSGSGFYEYTSGKKSAVNRKTLNLPKTLKPLNNGPNNIERRLVLSLLNEAARAFSEDVLSEPAHADLGSIFGFGFPPFLGGPFRYIDDLGVGSVVQELEHLESAVGKRFAPCELLTEMASTGRRFYAS